MRALEDTVKKEFFTRPKISEIIQGKKQGPLSRQYIVNTIENLMPDQYIVINWNIVQLLIDDGPYDDWQNFLKRGREINLRRYYFRQNAIEEKLKLQEIRNSLRRI